MARRSSTLLLAGCLTLLITHAAGAQSPAYLVKRVERPQRDISSNPDGFVRMGERIYFLADDGQHGEELWASDGTAAGTYLVKDIARGQMDSKCRILTAGEQFLWLTCQDWVHDKELWRSDGTAAGTVMVDDLYPGWDANIVPVRTWGDRLLFTSINWYLEGLWLTDGTAGGTYCIAGPIDPRSAVVFGDRVLLSAENELGEAGLWLTDGTDAGTSMFYTLCSEECGFSYGVSGFTQFNDKVYFRRNDHELWVTDGTASGTTLFRDMKTGFSLTVIDGVLIISTTDTEVAPPMIWLSDGTASGTVPVHTLPGGCYYRGMQRCGPHLLLLTYSKAEGKSLLWRTDATFSSTELLFDDDSYLYYMSDDLGGQVIFSDKEEAGISLIISDGSVAGTYRYTTVDMREAYWHRYRHINGRILFPAINDDGDTELWVTDGTDAGTGELVEIRRPDSLHEPEWLTRLGEQLAYAFQYGLWVSNGTPGGTGLLTDGFRWNSWRRSIWQGDGVVYFRGWHPMIGSSPWVSDGTPRGTHALAEAPRPTELVTTGDRIFFSGRNGYGEKLWMSDGTSWGTKLVKDFWPEWGVDCWGWGEECFKVYPESLTLVGSTLFSVARLPQFWQLWRSDGSEQGTRLLMEGGRPERLTASGEALYFTLSTSLGNTAGSLWRYGLRNNSPTEIWDTGELPYSLTAMGQKLYFLSTSSHSFVDGLWRANGNNVSLVRWLKVEKGGRGGASQLMAVGDTLFFVVTNELTGPELWASDGTAAGTRMVKDIVPGPAGSYPSSLRAIDDRLLLFAADDGETGLELWVSDGTERGTLLVADISPGQSASSPEQMTLAGDLVYFVAFHKSGDRELWAVPLAAIDTLLTKDLIFRDGFESGDLSAWPIN
jgi:ELWxxDGT repeat protein